MTNLYIWPKKTTLKNAFAMVNAFEGNITNAVGIESFLKENGMLNLITWKN